MLQYAPEIIIGYWACDHFLISGVITDYMTYLKISKIGEVEIS